MTTTVVTAWHVETDAYRIRRLGKSLEELGELVSVLARCLIQGVDEIDPSSGEVNRMRMQKETADVLTQVGGLTETFNLDMGAILERVQDKKASMDKWEELLVEEKQNILDSDWGIDTSAGRPILTYKNCSVIEAEVAEYVLGLIRNEHKA
jgi:NTP pyrophosphatase (non-canonical NTP hydrolase)